MYLFVLNKLKHRQSPRKFETLAVFWRERGKLVNLQLAELEDILPIPAGFLPDFLGHTLAAGLEHVGEAALSLQIFFRRQFVLGLAAQNKFLLQGTLRIFAFTLISH